MLFASHNYECLRSIHQNHFDAQHACGTQCPLECSINKYTGSVEHTNKRDLDFDMAPNSFASSHNSSIDSICFLKVYFTDFTYTKLTDIAVITKPYLIVSIVSTCIGAGVFIATGFGLLSFLELLEMFLEVLSILILRQPVVRRKVDLSEKFHLV